MIVVQGRIHADHLPELLYIFHSVTLLFYKF